MKKLMTSVGMMDGLEERLHEIISEFRLKANHGDQMKVPSIHFQYLPPKQQRSKEILDPDFPHVIIRYLGEKRNKEGQTTSSVRLIAGAYNEDHHTGIRDILNILTRIRNELNRSPFFGAFSIDVDSLEIEIPEEQYKPEWVGLLSVNIVIPTMQTEGGIHFDD